MPNEVTPNDKPNFPAVLAESVYCLALFLTLVAFGGILCWLFAPTLTEQYWYSYTRDVPRARVFVSTRPTDCYLVPIGGKRCHYEKVVDVGKDTSGNTQVTVYWQKISE